MYVARFYAAFLVAERVQVHSKHNDDEQWVWESAAGGEFTVGKDPQYPRITRGTHVVLYLKDDQKQAWTSDKTIRDTVKRHSEFIQYPIQLKVEKEVQEEAKEEKQGKEEGAARVEDVTDEEEEKKKAGRKQKQVVEWETLNTTRPIWRDNPQDVKDEEYEKLYKTLSADWEGPLGWKVSHLCPGLSHCSLACCPLLSLLTSHCLSRAVILIDVLHTHTSVGLPSTPRWTVVSSSRPCCSLLVAPPSTCSTARRTRRSRATSACT